MLPMVAETQCAQMSPGLTGGRAQAGRQATGIVEGTARAAVVPARQGRCGRPKENATSDNPPTWGSRFAVPRSSVSIKEALETGALPNRQIPTAPEGSNRTSRATGPAARRAGDVSRRTDRRIRRDCWQPARAEEAHRRPGDPERGRPPTAHRGVTALDSVRDVKPGAARPHAPFAWDPGSSTNRAANPRTLNASSCGFTGLVRCN